MQEKTSTTFHYFSTFSKTETISSMFSFVMTYGGLKIIERVIVFAQKPIWDFIQFKTIFLGDFIIDVLLLFGNITFGLLVIYQTYTLYKKRYQITKYDRI